MSKIVSKDEFARLMNAIKDTAEMDGDFEVSHIIADKLLVETLEGLGYDLKDYKSMKKWYA